MSNVTKSLRPAHRVTQRSSYFQADTTLGKGPTSTRMVLNSAEPFIRTVMPEQVFDDVVAAAPPPTTQNTRLLLGVGT